VFISQIVTDGQFEPLAAGTGRLVEVIGDNATAGYSSDGPLGVTTCAQPVNSVADPNQQNAANTYGVLAASAFGADWSLLAYSGRGLVQNFDGSTAMTLLDMYPRLNPLDISTMIPASPNAGVVVVNVGTNDINYWMQNKVGINPNVPAFTAAYVSLFQAIKALNPHAAIIATIGPTLGDYQCISGSSATDYACSAGGTLPALSTLRTAVQAAVSQASSSGTKVTFVEFPANSTNVSACYLPDAVGHQAMAQALIPAIAQATGWSQGASATQPAAAAKGTGPKTLTGTFAPWPDPLADPNATRLAITNKQFPQCHYCSPSPYNPNAVGTAACPALLGVLEPCQSYCHMPDGYQEPHGTNPPTSGNHYSTPAVNAAEFTSPVPRGNWIHSLEHGAIVLSYNCPNGCATELAVLRQAYQANNNNGSWIILTPDPLLPGPARFAALAWTYSLRFDTPDLNTLNCFIKQHAFYGRECLPKGVQSGCSPLLDKPMGSVEG
jgi:lysophospholipase L1-like esterase